jgi:beta-barrel assembly-enhancing protease
MHMKKVIISLFAMALVGCTTPTSMSPTVDSAEAAKEAKTQRIFALKEQFKMTERLANIAGPLKLSNVGLCGQKVRHQFGFTAQNSEGYEDSEWRTAFDSVVSGPLTNPIVLSVSEGMPASKALRPKDILISVDGAELAGAKWLEAFPDLDQETDYKFEIMRDGVKIVVPMRAVEVCDYPIVVQEGGVVNAFADGKAVYITKGMMRFASDDKELALVVGHELAHNIRDHIGAKRSNMIGGVIIGAILSGLTGVNMADAGREIGAAAYSQEFEEEADYIGAYLATRSGFDMEGAEQFWRKMAINHPKSIHLSGSSHPSSAKRFIAIRLAVEEIKEKQKSGKPLVPKER